MEGDELKRKEVEFSPRKLAIVSLAEQFTENPRIAKFKTFIKEWYLSYFYPDVARMIPQSGIQKHLNLHGDNVGNVVQYLERSHPRILKCILEDISRKIPGIGTIETYKDNITNNLYLLFKDKGFTTPFTQQQMSDGTLKMFCYMLLLQDPDSPPFIYIEEPENGLYHKLLETLTALSILMPKIAGEYNKTHTWKIHKHRGIGRLPDDLNRKPAPEDRTLLHNLPSKLRVYGHSITEREVVVLLVDLDKRDDCIAFKRQLCSVMDSCDKKPQFLVRIAIEELEAWFIGDKAALMQAYPGSDEVVLSQYVQDSRCGYLGKTRRSHLSRGY